MDNNKILQIFIITYNRGVFLDYTLSKIIDSQFCQFDIYVIDNCSDDETELICKKYSDYYENITIIRNKKNIGGSANYLRAVELSSSEYAWILCDDDVYDFSFCDDIIGEIKRKESDLLFVGSWEKLYGGGEIISTHDYFERYKKYFSITMYVPSVIFRVENFTPFQIRRGYYNTSNMFPHFSFYSERYLRNEKIYVAKKQIVYCADDGIHGFTKLDLTISFLNLAEQLPTIDLRSKFIDEVIFHNEGLIILLGRVVVTKSVSDKILLYHSGASYFLRVFSAVFRLNLLSPRHKIWLSLSALASLTPRFFCQFISKIFANKIQQKYVTDLPEEIVFLRNERKIKDSQNNLEKLQVQRLRNN